MDFNRLFLFCFAVEEFVLCTAHDISNLRARIRFVLALLVVVRLGFGYPFTCELVSGGVVWLTRPSADGSRGT
jgi:hypothetical protein